MTYSNASDRASCFDATARTPWNNTIFPGNYVCRLNSYRNQGVNSYPGLEFFSLVGALVVLPIENTQSNVLNSSLQLPAAEYALQILSPDLGPAPKPLANRDFVIPTGACIYSSAVNVVNLEAVDGSQADADLITVTGIPATLDSEPLQAVLGSDADGTFNDCGSRAIVLDFQAAEAAATSSDTSVTVTTSAALKPVNVTSGGSGSAFADPTAGQSAIIVEVDYFMVAKAPDSDDINLPYPYTSESTGY